GPDVQQPGGPVPAQDRADQFPVQPAPPGDGGIDERELRARAVQQLRVAVGAVHLLQGGLIAQHWRSYRREGAGRASSVSSAGVLPVPAGTSVIRAVSTVRPGPNAIEHTRSPSAPAREPAPSRMSLSTNRTVALDMFP